MKSSRKWVVTLLAVAVVAAACSDDRPDKGVPTAPRLVPGTGANAMGTCTTIGDLNALAAAVFGAGSPNVNSVLGKLDNLAKKVAAGDIQGAQDQANNIVGFVQQKAAQGTLPGTQAQITAFISGVLCYAGLSPDTFLILPSDAPQIRTSADGLSGVSLAGNTVNVPTLLTLTTITSGPSPLITKLDKYPSYVSITSSSPITKTATVAVCPTVSIPTEVRDRLRLGHQAASGFEITPPADGSFLTCTAATAQSRLPDWIRNVASLILPRPLYAAVSRRFGGGVGGLATEFSPFGAIDPELSFAGGVGGLASEFKQQPASPVGFGPQTSTPDSGNTGTSGSAAPGVSAAPGGPAFTVTAGECTAVAATVGTALEPECRPLVTLRTNNGTILEQVPVGWAVTVGGGQIAPNTISSQTCGNFGTTASTSTDALGKAGVCWTLGPNGGTNKATATPTAGGDAPSGVTFKPAKLYFTAEGLKITPSALATGGNFVFDGLAKPGSGSCTHGLTPALAYSGGSAPVSVGTYTLTVTCGTGSTVYNVATATATISIAAAVPVVSVTCPASVTYTGAALEPCTATATAPGLSLTPAPAYSNNTNAGTATATVTLAADGNYAAASGTANFTINPAPSITAVTCPAEPIAYSGSAIAPCSATTTGAGGLNVPTAVAYTNNTDAGTATAAATFGGDANHTGSSSSGSFVITPAATATAVSCPASATYTGSALTPCTASVSGPGGLAAALTPTYASNVNVGTATASANYAGGGNYLPSSGTGTFAIVAAGTSVLVTCPSSVAYNGSAQSPCTAAASGPDFSGLPVSVTYAPSPTRNAGVYVATGTYAGGGNYLGSSATGSFNIAKIGATATSGSATINFGDPIPTIPCSVSGLLAGDAGTVTCASSVGPVTTAGAYPATPVVSPSNPTNYAMTLVSGALTVMKYVQVGCFASPVYSEMPSTKSAQRRGSNLPVKCTLTNQQGVAVTTATGNLAVYDVGTQAVTPPAEPATGATPVFSGTNVFKYSNGGNYAYGLATDSLISGHYYYVVATWSDGSVTKGWFLVK